MRLLPTLLVLTLLLPASAWAGPAAVEPLYARYDSLLRRHVHGLGVDYEAWHDDAADRKALDEVIEGLADLDPAPWAHDESVAYWINLYNAATLRLVLEHYPLDSIKDIGSLFSAGPWSRKVVRVAGRDLSLDEIEKKILLPLARDARVHFAVNCASVGCPPLRDRAWRGQALDEQLDRATRFALHRPRWLRIDGDTVFLTKIFDWYEKDFERDAGSVRAFLARYRDDLPPGDYSIEIMDYDWDLNAAGP